MEFLSFFMKGQAKIDAHNRKTEQTKQTLLSELKHQLVTARDNGDETNEIKLLLKLGNVYADTIHQSFITYAERVSKAHKNVLTSFIIPFYIKGLTY